MGDTVNIDGEEIDLSKLTERQQIALLLRQSEEEARNPHPSRRKPPSTPRSRAKDDTGRERPPSSGKRENPNHFAYDEFASDALSGPKEGLWSPREHGLFMELIEAHAGTEINWSTVVDKIGSRTEQQCEEYMQRLMDRGLVNHEEAPAPREEPLQKRARTEISPVKQTRARANAIPTYRRVRSDEIPVLLPKVAPAEIKSRAKALLLRIEHSEQQLAQAVAESEPPELHQTRQVAAQAPDLLDDDCDPELLLQQSKEREQLLAWNETQTKRLVVWFREGCDREAFEGDEDAVPVWDRVNLFVKSKHCLAPQEPIPTPQPPKKRIAKLIRQFEHVKAGLVKVQQEEAKTLAMLQAWRRKGCKAAQPNEDLIKQVLEPQLLTLAAHIVGEVLPDDFPAIKVQFPYYVKT